MGDIHAESMSLDAVLERKREYLWPCMYHFYKRPPLIAAAEDCELIDAQGRRYLDFFSGVTVVNAGHCNREINAAVVAQMDKLDHTTSIYLSEPIVRLAERLAGIMPAGLKRSFFGVSGSEANEGALLLASLYTGRREFLSLDGSLHGRTKAAMSVTGLRMWRTDPFPLATCHFVPRPDQPDSLDSLEKTVREIGADRIAALIAEPVQGNGGIVVPPSNYWPRVRKLCDETGILLIFDEVQTGMGRTGRWWASQHWSVVPDIVTTAKALANGYPISAVVTTDRIAAAYTRPGASTFGGNPVAAVAALATIDFHERHSLAARSARLGEKLLLGLQRICSRHGRLTQPRGLGLMVAADVVDDAGAPSAERIDALLESMKDRGVLVGKSGPDRNTLTMLPPLTISPPQIEMFLDNLEATLKEVS